jgi:hypothetical protein
MVKPPACFLLYVVPPGMKKCFYWNSLKSISEKKKKGLLYTIKIKPYDHRVLFNPE